MRQIISFGLFFLFINVSLYSDGKFYYIGEQIPPHDAYQRAIVAYHNGEELLLIQPKLVGHGKDFGWVVPVPKEPRIGYMELVNAERIFANLLLRTESLVIDIRSLIRIAVFAVLLICLGILIVLLVLGLLGYQKQLPISLGSAILFIVVLLFFFFLFMPTVSVPRSVKAVEVLSTHKVGIYEAKVLKATDAGALREWLTQNGFRFTPEDEQAFNTYILKGWLFVTARIAAETDSPPTTVQGMIQPLALSFATSELVYPFALTATSETPTDVLLYVMTDHPVTHPALQRDFAARQETYGFYEHIKWSDESESSIQDKFPGVSFLTRLKGRLSSEKVKDDLILQPDPSDRSYRKKIWRW